jgi:hypothetical protein
VLLGPVQDDRSRLCRRAEPSVLREDGVSHRGARYRAHEEPAEPRYRAAVAQDDGSESQRAVPNCAATALTQPGGEVISRNGRRPQLAGTGALCVGVEAAVDLQLQLAGRRSRLRSALPVFAHVTAEFIDRSYHGGMSGTGRFRTLFARLAGLRAKGQPRAVDWTPEAERMRSALEMHELGVQLYRQRMHREHPYASPADIDDLVRAWLVAPPPDTRLSLPSRERHGFAG